MLKVRDLDAQQGRLMKLLTFARKEKFVTNGALHSPVIVEFVELFTKGSAEALTRQELTRLTLLTQTLVGLPVYTTEMASGWLGVGIDAIRTAIWKSDPPALKTMKMGHDVLIEHEELVRFLDNGN